MAKHGKRHAGSNSPSPTVDICILTAGRYDMLAKCLNSVEREVKDVPANVYVFDNGGPGLTDELKGGCIKEYKRVTRNRGYPGGANAVIGMGQAPLVLFVSDDVVLLEGALAHLVLTMQDKSIGICGLKLLFPSDGPSDPARPAGKIQHVGHSVSLAGTITHPFMSWSPNNPRVCVSQDVFSVTGAVFMVRREIFHKAGKFSEDYGLGYFEDVELCLHIKSLGFRIYLDAEAQGTHYVGATMANDAKAANDSIQKNQQIFMLRNQQYLRWDEFFRY